MNLRKGVSTALVKAGYRRDDRMHHLAIAPGVSFWVDTGPLGKRDDIAPAVGLRHDEIEHLLADLMELPRDEWVGTAGANVGYVLGQQYRHWQSPSTVSEVIETIEAAKARLTALGRVEQLPDVWQIVGRDDPWWRYREIVALFLAGDRESISGRLAEASKVFCKRQDEICEQFATFSRQLTARLAA
jgi:hypothetical protein